MFSSFSTNAYVGLCVTSNNNSNANTTVYDNVRINGVLSKPVVLHPAGPELPETFAVAQNVPNPFNPETAIAYALPRQTEVVLKIYNLLGQEVRRLVDGVMPAGYHRVVWDGRDAYGRRVSSGVYIYRLVAGDFLATHKMLVLK